MDLTWIKVIVAVVLFILMFSAGFIPWLLVNKTQAVTQERQLFSGNHRLDKILQAAGTFSIGVILSISFTNLFPSAKRTWFELQNDTNYHHKFAQSFPLVESCVFQTTLLIWLLPLIVQLFLSNKTKYGESNIFDADEAKSSKIYAHGTLRNDQDENDNNGEKIETLNSELHKDDQHKKKFTTNDNKITVTLLFVFSVFTESTLESISLGTLQNITYLIQMSVSKILHESLCAFVVSVKLMESASDFVSTKYLPLIITFFYALVSAGSIPVGDVIGNLNSKSGMILILFFQIGATGAIFNVIFIHLIPNKISSFMPDTNVFKDLGLISAGFLATTSLHFLHFII